MPGMMKADSFVTIAAMSDMIAMMAKRNSENPFSAEYFPLIIIYRLRASALVKNDLDC